MIWIIAFLGTDSQILDRAAPLNNGVKKNFHNDTATASRGNELYTSDPGIDDQESCCVSRYDCYLIIYKLVGYIPCFTLLLPVTSLSLEVSWLQLHIKLKL